MPERPPHTHLPLKPVLFWILLVLEDRSSHGYRILKEIEARSEGRFRLEPGNLYRYLRKLLDDGLIEEEEQDASADDRRRTYGVTPLGRAVIQAETERMRALVQAVDMQRANADGASA